MAEKHPKKQFAKYWLEFLFTEFELSYLLAAAVQYNHSKGEDLYLYLTLELGMSEGGAEMVVSKLKEIVL